MTTKRMLVAMDVDVATHVTDDELNDAIRAAAYRALPGLRVNAIGCAYTRTSAVIQACANFLRQPEAEGNGWDHVDTSTNEEA